MTVGEGDTSAADHEALLSFLYHAPVGLVQCDAHGDIALINPLAAQMLLPLTRDPALANLYAALADLLPDLRQRVAAFPARHGRVCDGLRLAIRPSSAAASGAPRPAWLSLTLLKLGPGQLMAVIDDVSEQVRRERLLAGGRQWLEAMLEGDHDWAQLRLDAQGRVVECDAALRRLTGLRPDDVIGRSHAELACTPAAAGLSHLADADRDGWSLHDADHPRAGGGRFRATVLIVPMPQRHTDPEAGYHLVLRSGNGRPEAAEELLHALHTDVLTGVANRRAFFDTATREVRRCRLTARPLSLLLIDADHFKAINDRHGHAGGDGVLRHLAQCLQQTFRGEDLLARIGGEEFAVLLPGTDGTAASAIAERLCQAVAARPALLPDACVAVTVSVGVAMLEPADGDDLDALLQRADAALYAAKAGGRNGTRLLLREAA